MLCRLPIASAQVLILADQSGELAAVECNCERISVIRPHPNKPFVFTTNHFNNPDMQIYQPADADDWFSKRRYETLRNAFQTARHIPPDLPSRCCPEGWDFSVNMTAPWVRIQFGPPCMI